MIGDDKGRETALPSTQLAGEIRTGDIAAEAGRILSPVVVVVVEECREDDPSSHRGPQKLPTQAPTNKG
jgi:hypothetical protein